MLAEELANQRQRTFEPAKKLIEVGSKIHSIFNSILIPLYIQLRNSYGVVLYQLHKDFQYNNNTLHHQSVFKAISDKNMIRDIVGLLLIGLFPDDNFVDDVLDRIERGSRAVKRLFSMNLQRQ